LAGYAAVTLAYSLSLKARPMLDVLVLAALYTSRIVAGGLATGIPVTEWLAAWSMFLFLSLALLKRASEMAATDGALAGRGYVPVDRDSMFQMGITSGYLSVLIFALYISSEHVKLLYVHPDYLWGLCALMLYWISQMWICARRGLVRDDPIIFALKDRTTQALVPIGAIVLILAAR
jgi:4-hydroxybenzoate polyprenyltransferase